MFSKTTIIKYTKDYLEQIEQLAKKINLSDAILVGAGAGLSTSAGFTYSGRRFEENFPDFIEKYGFQDMYSAGFYPYKTLEEYWAYWSRYIYCNRYIDPPFSTYRDLLGLVKEKDYFVITTNVDHCFQKAGFDKKRLFYTQGDYGLFQCSEPCCNETFDNKDIVYQMIAQQKDMRVPSALLPICPHCGKPLTMNLRSDNKFVEDEGWHLAAERYASFLRTRKNLRILFLEIGVGYNTPGIIKYPFWQMTYQNQKAVYACVNNGEAWAPKEIAERSICINKDNREVLRQVANEK